MNQYTRVVFWPDKCQTCFPKTLTYTPDCRDGSSLFPSLLTHSHLQQSCSRQLWKHLYKNIETFFESKKKYWMKWKTLWQKQKLLIMSNFSFSHNFLKKQPLLQRCQKGLNSECKFFYFCMKGKKIFQIIFNKLMLCIMI